MGLSITRRTATMGSGINTRTEKHGDEDILAFDIPIKGVPLTQEDLEEVTLNKSAYKLLYRKVRNRPDEPVWGQLFQPLAMNAKVKGANVTLYVGRKALKLIDVNLAKVRIEIVSGGISLLHFQIQCKPALDDTLEALFEKVNKPIDLAIECDGYGEQPELPLEEGDEGEDGEAIDPAGEQTDLEDEIGARRARRSRKQDE